MGAIVEAHDPGNGARWQTVTRRGGAYSLENVSVGGPYRLTVRAIGFEPATRGDLFLSLGQRLTVDVLLQPAVVQLPALVVSVPRDPLLSTGRTGPAQSIPESTLARLPIPGRDFSLAALLSPQVVRSSSGGLSIAGQPDRLNALQIDGATNNDLLGFSSLAGVGTPGRDRGARTLSVEAVKELQIVSAPFDVRFGNFAAGLVNAVTKSGANALAGTLSSHFSNRWLIGKDMTGSRGAEFETGEVGVAVGAPIARDRVAIFLDGGMERNTLPEDVPLIGADTTGGADSVGIGIRRASLVRFQEILRNTYHVDPGTGDRYPLRVHSGNLFAKITVQLGVNSRLEVSHNYSRSKPDVLTFSSEFSCRYPGGFCLSSSSFRLPVTTQATRLEWQVAPGARFANELLVARLRSRSTCEPGVTSFPDIGVHADQGELTAGAADFCVGQSTTEQLLELTDNLTITAGNHRLTIGTHDELVRLPHTSPLEFQLYNRWHFASLDSLEEGLADIYSATFRNPARAPGPLSDLRVGQVGFYVQDQWTPVRRLVLTAGLRLDVPNLSTRPHANPALQSELGFDNTRTPSGYRIWSPRVGVNFDARGDGSTFLRGGVGLFAGRPAYKWFDAVYSHTGLEAIHLECTGAEVPPFVPALADQPTHCGSSATNATPYVDLFDPAFRFPRNLKLALGADRRLAWGVVGTVDLLFTKGVDQFFLTDVNLLGPQSRASGEGGRVMYGTIDGFGSATSARRSAGFGPVFRITNAKGDRALSITGQLQKRFANGTEFGIAYTHSSSRDRFSAVADASDDDFGQVPVDGTLDERNLAASAWSVPHKVSLVATANLPRGFRLSLFYLGVSGHPFTYVVAGDANADGAGDPFAFVARANDIVYVPRDAGDISLAVPDPSGVVQPAPASDYARLEGLIRSQRCLRDARGRIAPRNSCRNPWSNQTSARLSRVFPTRRGQSLELIMDVFNVLRLLSRHWGIVRDAGGGGSEVPLLHLLRYEQGSGRGVYQLLPVEQGTINSAESRWRIQLGARYAF